MCFCVLFTLHVLVCVVLACVSVALACVSVGECCTVLVRVVVFAKEGKKMCGQNKNCCFIF